MEEKPGGLALAPQTMPICAARSDTHRRGYRTGAVQCRSGTPSPNLVKENGEARSNAGIIHPRFPPAVAFFAASLPSSAAFAIGFNPMTCWPQRSSASNLSGR
jgi:hypothetical protein